MAVNAVTCERCGSTTVAPYDIDGEQVCKVCWYEDMLRVDLVEIAESLDVPKVYNKSKRELAVAIAARDSGDPKDGKAPQVTKSSAPDKRTTKRSGLPGTSKVIDAEQGIVEAITSVFGVIDDGDDMIHPGAFTKTLSEHADRVRILDSHNMFSTDNVIGFPVEMKEVQRDDLPQKVLDKYPEATGGLKVVMQFRMNTQKGRDTFDLIERGQLEYSIGFDIVQADMSKVVRDDKGRYIPTHDSGHEGLVRDEKTGRALVVRNIRQIRLWDVSPVVWGMNPATATVSVKSAIGSTDLDFWPLDYEWSEGEATARLIEWAGGEDDIDFEALARAHFFVNDDMRDEIDGYHWPFADVTGDGTIRAVPEAIMTYANLLESAGDALPDGMGEADANAIANTITTYYARLREEFDGFDQFPPWADVQDTGDGGSQRKIDALTRIMKTVSGAVDLPLADRGREWDSESATARVREWAGGPDKESMDWSAYNKAFFWYDGDDPENFTSYKLPFADVIDGTLTAVPRGIFAVAGVLEGARGGVDIPEADAEQISGKVTRYYARMREEFDDDSIVPPWTDVQDTGDGPDSTSRRVKLTTMKAYVKLDTAMDLITQAHDMLSAVGAIFESNPTTGREPQDAPTPKSGAGPRSAEAPERDDLLRRIQEFEQE